MNGFNWLLYFLFYNRFTEKLITPPSDVFGFAANQVEEWGGLNYADQIKNVALSVGGLFGQLPPAIIYLFSIGFTFLFIGIIYKVVSQLF